MVAHGVVRVEVLAHGVVRVEVVAHGVVRVEVLAHGVVRVEGSVCALALAIHTHLSLCAQFDVSFKLLLTGTPVQNNLQEV